MDWVQMGDIQAAVEAGRQSVQITDLLEDGTVVAFVRPGSDGGSTYHLEDLERYAAAPRRATGNVTLRDVASFAAYVQRHQGDGTVVFADDSGGMHAVFDHHAASRQPGWRGLTANLKRPRTVAFNAWMKAADQPMGQVEFANFLEERLQEIASPAGADLLEAAEHFRAHTIVRFRSQQRLRDGQTQLEYIEQVEGGAEHDGRLTIPDKLVVQLQPFRDCEPFQVEARLRWRVQERRVLFTVLFDDRLEEQLEAVYDAAIETVAAATTAPVLRGQDA